MPSACSPSSQILQDLVWLRIKLDHASALYGRFLKFDYPKPLVFPWILTYFGWFWGPHFRNPPYPCFASRLPEAYIGIYFKDVTWCNWCNTSCDFRSLRCAEQAVFPIPLCVTSSNVFMPEWQEIFGFAEILGGLCKMIQTLPQCEELRAGWGKFGSATGTIVQTYFHHNSSYLNLIIYCLSFNSHFFPRHR